MLKRVQQDGVVKAACALAVGSALLAAPALAQDTPIVVTGRGLGDNPAVPVYDVRTLPRDVLTSTASNRIEDALASVAGFQQFRRSDSRSSNPSAQGVTLRALGGNATSRALVLLDGVPMADPFFGYIPLSALAPERLASARVTRGGGSGAFGAGAVAGTIELTSADAMTHGLVSGSAAVNQRGESELSGTLAPRLGDGFAVLSGRWDRGKGFRTAPSSQRVPASVRARFDSWSTGIRAVFPVAPGIELQARGLLFDDRRTLRFAGADTASAGQDASLRLVGRGAWAFDVLGYVQARDFSNVVISSTTFRKTLDQYATPSTGLGGKAELRPPLGGAHVLRLGADWRAGSGEAKEAAFNAATGAVTARRRAGGRSSDLGLYLEDDWTPEEVLGGRVVLTAGLRADRWTISGGRFRETTAAGAVTDTRFAARSGSTASWRGGARLDAGGGLALRAAGYTGLRLPTLNELYRPFAVFPVTTRANAALANERLRGFEAGLDYRPSTAVALSLTAFDDRLRNAIANVTIGTNLRQRRNVDAVRARGIEASADLRAGDFRLDASLALTDAEVRAPGSALDGKRPAQTARLAASATAGWNRSGFAAALTLRRTGRQFEDDLETDALPAATTLDVFVQAPLGGDLSLILRAENLTDRRVVTRNQAGSTDLGAPRTLWIGLRVGR
jgi:vitamin B12 transporter